MSKQRILFLYLMAGNGHYMPAKTLQEEIKEQYGDDVEVILENGISPRQKFSHLIFEEGYHVSANYLYYLWKFVCFVNQSRFVRDFLRLFIERPTTRYISDLIRQHNITHIVCTNYVFCSNAYNAIIRGNYNIPLTIIVTDPFDAHPVWFDVRQAHYILFSKKLQDTAINNYNIKSSVVFPYIIQQKFKSAGQIKKDCGHFTVLIAGGGEGLPNMVPLAYYILFNLTKDADTKPEIKLIVVCGRNKSAYEILKRYTLIFHRVKADIHCYVNNMNELLQTANCIITKPGATITMEALASGTPIIASTYLPQEKSNVQYIEENNTGWFIKSRKKIYDKICTLAADKKYYDGICDNIRRLNVRVNNSALAKHICEYAAGRT